VAVNEEVKFIGKGC